MLRPPHRCSDLCAVTTAAHSLQHKPGYSNGGGYSGGSGYSSFADYDSWGMCTQCMCPCPYILCAKSWCIGMGIMCTFFRVDFRKMCTVVCLSVMYYSFHFVFVRTT